MMNGYFFIWELNFASSSAMDCMNILTVPWLNFRRSWNQFKCNRTLSVTMPGEMFRLFVFLTSNPDFCQRLLVGLYLNYIFIPFKEKKCFLGSNKNTRQHFTCPLVSLCPTSYTGNKTHIIARIATRAVF